MTSRDFDDSNLESEFEQVAVFVNCIQLFDAVINPLDWLLLMSEDSNPIQKVAAEVGGYIKEETKGFLAKVFGEALEEAGGWAADHIRLQRFKNFHRVAEEAQKFVKQKGLDPQIIPPKLLMPIIEKSSLETDEDMQDRWAKLMASAACGNEVHQSFPRILSEIEPIEAKVLDMLYQERIVSPHSRTQWYTRGITKKKIQDSVESSPEQIDIAIDNLTRLRMCQTFDVHDNPTPESSQKALLKKLRIMSETYYEISITPLGVAFVKACTGPK